VTPLTRAFALGLALAFVPASALAQTDTSSGGGDTSAAPTTGGTEAAQTPEDPARVAQARDQYREGVAAFRSRRFGDALVAFERSFRLRPHPTTLYNAAEARLRAGDREGAIDQLRQLLAMTTPAPDAQTVDRARALAREAGVDNLTPAENNTPTCPTCPACPPQRECPSCPTVQPSVQHGPLPYVLAGGSVAFLAAGMIFYGVALGDAGAYIDSRSVDNCPNNPAAPSCAALRSQGEAFRWVGLTGIVLGVAAGVASVYVYTHPSPHADHPARRSGFRPVAHVDVAPNGLMVSGTF
jgi:hypothetical protein